LLDDVYVGGILHDMGKIIFFSIHPHFLDKIREFCVEKNLPSSTLEDISAGMNHAELGALISEKWKFPDRLVAAIRYHHDPESAPKDCKSLVDTVYLANILCEYENGNVSFDQIEAGPLKAFGLHSQRQIDNLLDRLALGYEREINY